jgi:superfamily II DNA or RNA helicase
MSLKDLIIKPVYNSNDDIEKFYNETLEQATVYKRASGFFTHGLLKYITKGILGLIKNEGKFDLIISNKVDEGTFNKIKQGYELVDDKISLDEIEENISDLAFLIAIGLVNIKIAFTRGIYHEKYGLLMDLEKNIILFSGSNNETEAAIKENFESFETTINWDCSERDLQKINHRINEFDKMWHNEMDNLYVCDAPEALYSNILRKLDGEQSIDLVEKNALFVDYINEQLIFYFNFDYNIDKWYKFELWKSLLEDKTTRKIVFKKNISVVDFEEILNSLENKMNSEKVELLKSKNISIFYENRILDLVSLSQKGLAIKNKNFLFTKEYEDYKHQINKLLNRDLRDMQVLGSIHIVELQRTFNFSVPGSGKTATVLGAFRYLESMGKIEKLLVLGPINSFKAWKDEIMTVLGYRNIIDLSKSSNFDDKRLELQYNNNKSKIIFLNFEGTLNSYNIVKKYINSKVMVVFDEIHKIKGLESKTYNASRHIIENTSYRVALTGTPLPNGYIDLRNQFEILYGDYHKTYFEFGIGNLKSKDASFNKYNVLSQEIRTKIDPFYVRVTKEDLKVPAPNPDFILKINETEDLVIIYRDISESKINSMEKIIKKIKVGTTPLLPEENESFLTEKVKKCLELVKDIIAKNESVIIWTTYLDSLNKIYSLLSKEYNFVKKIFGDTEVSERDVIIDDFNLGKVRILITNPHTLAESVSLHKICNNAIYLELDYNLTHYLQSRDRIHRLGIEDHRQTNYFILQSCYGDQSIDERIYNVLDSKRIRMKDSIDSALMIEKFNEEIIEELSSYE